MSALGDQHAVLHPRFNPLDKRCGINLDEIDPAQWSLLEAATEDYIAASQDRFQELANILATPAQAAGQLACSAVPLKCLKAVWLSLIALWPALQHIDWWPMQHILRWP